MSLDLEVDFPSIPYVFSDVFCEGPTLMCNNITYDIQTHTHRAQKLIISIALGILGMIPLMQYAILNKKIPSITLIRSTFSLYKSTELFLGIVMSVFSLSMGLKYFIEQKASIKKIHDNIQILKKFITDTTKVDFQNVFYEKKLDIFKLDNDVLTNDERIKKLLPSVLRIPNYFLKSYPTYVVIKSTLCELSLSIFTTRSPSLVIREIYGNDCRDRCKSSLAWVDLLTHLVKSKAKLPEGTLECVTALTQFHFDSIRTHTFGISLETAAETQDLPHVKYEIKIRKDGTWGPNVSYKKEGAICSACLNTPDEFFYFLKNDLGCPSS